VSEPAGNFCPYVGLEPFESAHAPYFFGRGRESKIIADHVIARQITVLYGPSGIGKSSIINVGLPAALAQIAGTWKAARERRQRETGSTITPASAGDDWLILRLRNWQDPETLERLAVDALLGELGRRPRVHRFAFAPLIAWAARSTGCPILIIFDQFEEYFLYRERSRMQEIEQAFGNLIARRDLPLHLLVVVRDDALHHLDQLRAFAPAILDTTIELRGLNDAGIQEAIRGPIDRYNETYRDEVRGIRIEDALVATLIRQLKQSENETSKGRVSTGEERRVELPYLQLALTKLWAAKGDVPVMRESMLIDQLGGVDRIVRDHVNSVMASLSPDEQALCAKMFDRLVTALGGKVAYPTAGLAAAEVVGPNVSQEEVEAVLNKLTPKEARILKPVMANGLPGFEIFHDVLGLPVLGWKRDFDTREKERSLAQAVRRPMRHLRRLAYLLALVLTVGLIGWFNQSYLREQWRWYAVARPFLTTTVEPYVLSAEAERALKAGSTFRECASPQGRDNCPEMIVVPAGNFIMGSPPDEKGRSADEGPQHPVTIANSFAVSKYETTFDEWDTCVAYGDCAEGVNDGGWGRGRRPLINVTWDDAQRYVEWLAKITGKPYRLLAEDEYEYATRAGTRTAFPWGDEIGTGNANCKGCGSRWDGSQPAPVGAFPPNQFGLYDMVGNVWAWVFDCYHPNYENAPRQALDWTTACPDSHVRVFRGGSWSTPAVALRSASRGKNTNDSRFGSVGFRVARTLTP
jgi:formylglycine-generating enzyme required for sulfatase activity